MTTPASSGPNRILIVGTPCSGREETADRLARYSSLPKRPAPDGERWIVVAQEIDHMDGAVEQADLILWLDFGRFGCLVSAVGRVLMGSGTPAGQLFGEIWSMPTAGRPRIERKLEGLRTEQTVMQLSRKKDLDFWIARYATRIGA